MLPTSEIHVSFIVKAFPSPSIYKRGKECHMKWLTLTSTSDDLEICPPKLYVKDREPNPVAVLSPPHRHHGTI